MNHTPTPWNVSTDPNFGTVEIHHTHKNLSSAYECVAVMRESLGGDRREANAAFILRAVNVHDELVLAVQCALDFVEGYYSDMTKKEMGEMATVKRLRAAIAKAEAR